MFGLKLKDTMKKILIVCTGNSCRSQMAEAWMRKFAGDKAQVFSAGTHPEKVNTNAIIVMEKKGVDISKNKSNHVSEYMEIDFDYMITVCDNAKENCPIFPNAKHVIHKSFPDPAKEKETEKEILHTYANVRDSLKEFVLDFVEKEFDIYVKKEPII